MRTRPKLVLVPDCGRNMKSRPLRGPRLTRVNVRPEFVPTDPACGLNGERQLGAGTPPLGGDLPQVPGVGVELPGEGFPAGHVVDDVLQGLHGDPTIAIRYPLRNSNPRADKNSSLLHHPVVGGIKELEQLRRTNLARLRKKFGPAKLAEATGLSVAHLYQMSAAKPPHARNVNDQHARLIESKAGLPDGWLDQTEPTNVQPITRKKGPEWPFPFTYAELMALDDPMRDAAIAAAASIVNQARKTAARKQK